MSELGKVEGKTFLVTGGASGLGAGFVQEFLKNGAKAVAILDISENAGKATSERLNKTFPGKVVFIKCDISSEDSLTEAFSAVVNKMETVDVVINNAGVMNDSSNVWRKASDVNYQGVVSLALKSIKHMSNDEGGKGGTIINVASTLGFLKYPFLPIYSGCKAGIIHFSQSIAMDPFHQRTGIRIITMCFGATKTPLLNNLERRSYDEKCDKEIAVLIASTTVQTLESAVNGLVEAFKQGTNGSIWLAAKDRPAKDISQTFDKAHDLLISTLKL